MKLSSDQLKTFLDEKVDQYNRVSFVTSDPICIPHMFQSAEDIEIAGFLVSIFAWGQRKTIINNGHKLMILMENSPCDFLRTCSEKDLDRFSSFVHRTFNGIDCTHFIRTLKSIYINEGGLFNIMFGTENPGMDVLQAIKLVRERFLRPGYPLRTSRHFPDVEKGSAAKRMNMFLRWMVRKDNRGVDFGLWDTVPCINLLCPLDLHSGRVARKLGLLMRPQDDFRAVKELTERLIEFDPADPVKYDFALFGLGVFEKF
jgi:uncharacterized protein (TIGR02757 family)